MSRLTTKDFSSRQQAKTLFDQVFVAIHNVSKPSELTKIALLPNGRPHMLSVYEALALQSALINKFWCADSSPSELKNKDKSSKKRKRVEEHPEEPAKKKAKNYHYYPVSTEEKTALKILGKVGESLFSIGMFEALHKASVETITDLRRAGTYARTKPIARVASRLTGAKDADGENTSPTFVEWLVVPYVAVNPEGKYYIIDRLVSTGRTSTEKTNKGYTWVHNPKMAQDKKTGDGKTVRVPFIVDAMSTTMSESIYKALELEMPAGGRSGIDAVSLAEDIVLEVDPAIARVPEGDKPLPATITLPFGLSMERLRELFIHLGGLASADKKEKNKRKIKLLRDFATKTEPEAEMEEDKSEQEEKSETSDQQKPKVVEAEPQEEKVLRAFPSEASESESDSESEQDEKSEGQDQEMANAEEHKDSPSPVQSEQTEQTEQVNKEVPQEPQEPQVPQEQNEDQEMSDEGVAVLSTLKTPEETAPEIVVPVKNTRAREVVQNTKKSNANRPVFPSTPVPGAMSSPALHNLLFVAEESYVETTVEPSAVY